MNLRVALCAVVVVSLLSCKAKPTLDGPCDGKQLAALRSALSTVDASQRATITTVGLGEACAGKLPSGIVDGIKALGEVSPFDRATVIAAMLSEDLSFARRACEEWTSVSSGVGSVPFARKAALLYSGCEFKRFDLLTAAEFEQSWKASGYALLAVPMYAWLVEKNMEPAEARRLARAMFLDEELPAPAEPPTAE